MSMVRVETRCRHEARVKAEQWSEHETTVEVRVLRLSQGVNIGQKESVERHGR